MIMKNFLFGLALSSIPLMAAKVDSTQLPKDETSVFLTKGKVNVKITLSTDVPTVRYVVFASSDGTLTNATDTLELPTFYIEFDKNSVPFYSDPNKIYVKKVEKGSLTVLKDLDTQEQVRLKVTLAGMDPSYSYYSNLKIGHGLNYPLPVTAFFTKAQLTGFATNAYNGMSQVTNIDVDYRGVIHARFNGTQRYLQLPKSLEITNLDGTLTFKAVTNKDFSSSSAMTEQEAKPLLDELNGKSNTVFLHVTL